MSMVAENMKMIAECSKKLIELREKLGMIEEEKTKYPKSYEECVKCIKSVKEASDRAALLCKLERLLVCRDAYWKIAGDWKPEYPFNTARYVITNSKGFAGKVLVYDAAKNYILEFPTVEMRDAFYENFKELIEQCKELL